MGHWNGLVEGGREGQEKFEKTSKAMDKELCGCVTRRTKTEAEIRVETERRRQRYEYKETKKEGCRGEFLGMRMELETKNYRKDRDAGVCVLQSAQKAEPDAQRLNKRLIPGG